MIVREFNKPLKHTKTYIRDLKAFVAFYTDMIQDPCMPVNVYRAQTLRNFLSPESGERDIAWAAGSLQTFLMTHPDAAIARLRLDGLKEHCIRLGIALQDEGMLNSLLNGASAQTLAPATPLRTVH